MSKSAILNPAIGQMNENLKTYVLSFDKLYVDEDYLRFPSKEDSTTVFIESLSKFRYETDFLISKDIVETYKYEIDRQVLKAESAKLAADLYKNFPVKNIADIADNDSAIDYIFKSSIDSKLRHDAIVLKNSKNVEPIPIFYSSETFAELGTKKVDVFSFLLKQLPVPNSNTSWEQIMEFRSDKDIQSNYLALMTWINTVVNSNKSLSDIEDEFNYLYNQYMRHYKLHKMKSEMTTVEILISTAIDALTSLSVGGLLKQLFTIRKSKISLLEEELKLPGREIAYIYKASETFSNL